MKIVPYSEIESVKVDTDTIKGVTGRVTIGKADGAHNFCMRIFELAPGGFTPRHRHAWEHEIFFHGGKGEVFDHGQWKTVEAGSVAFIPGEEEHQIRNTGDVSLIFVCLVPKEAPEM